MPQVKQDGYVTTVKYKYKGRIEPHFRVFFEYETADDVQKTITKGSRLDKTIIFGNFQK
jgi:hypothetical protein